MGMTTAHLDQPGSENRRCRAEPPVAPTGMTIGAGFGAEGFAMAHHRPGRLEFTAAVCAALALDQISRHGDHRN